MTERCKKIRLPQGLLRLPDLMVITFAGCLNPQLVNLGDFLPQFGELVGVRWLFRQMKMLMLTYLREYPRSDSGDIGVSRITRFVSA